MYNSTKNEENKYEESDECGSTKNEENKYEECDEFGSPTVKGEEKLYALNNKIDIVLQPTGNAPILKNRKWKVKPDRRIGYITSWLRQLLKLSSNDCMFLYVNQAFAPSPDQTIQNLYECYGVNGSLTFHYCITQAWG